MATAKVFWSGRSQAIRLPKEYRFEGSEVRIRRVGQGLLLEPVVEEWGWLEQAAGAFDADFIRAALDRPRDPLPQTRTQTRR